MHLRRGKTGEVEETNDIEAGKDPEGVSPPEDAGNQMFQTFWLPHIAELVQGSLYDRECEDEKISGATHCLASPSQPWKDFFYSKETIFYTSQLVNAETTRGIRKPVAANKLKHNQ